jgi:hypothetical protein
MARLTRAFLSLACYCIDENSRFLRNKQESGELVISIVEQVHCVFCVQRIVNAIVEAIDIGEAAQQVIDGFRRCITRVLCQWLAFGLEFVHCHFELSSSVGLKLRLKVEVQSLFRNDLSGIGGFVL